MYNGPSSKLTLSCSVDAEVTSVYTPESDGELTDLDVETKELGLFDPLNLPAMPKTGGAQSKVSGMEKKREVPTSLMPQHNHGRQRTLGNVSQLEM